MMKVANSVGMKTKTSTNKTIKSLKKTRKKVITQKMMKHLPLKIMLNAEVKIKRAEGKISGTLSTMMRFTQDQRREAAEEQEAATVVERGVADSMLTLEMNTTKGRHQCIMIPGMKELAKIDIRDPNPEVLIDMKRIEEEMEGEEYPLQNSAIQEDLPQCQ